LRYILTKCFFGVVVVVENINLYIVYNIFLVHYINNVVCFNDLLYLNVPRVRTDLEKK